MYGWNSYMILEISGKKALQWVKQVCYNTAVAKISRL